MASVEFYEKNWFEGPDASLEISLLEYGLAWQKTEFPERTEYKFLYGIDHDGKQYTKFDYSFMDKKEFENICRDDWFDLPKVLEFCGMEETKFFDMFPFTVSDAIAYHGYENIFGSTYSEGIEIQGVENE